MKIISGKWQNGDGSAVANGRVFFKLSADAAASGSLEIAPKLVSFNLDANGLIPANSKLWANDELTPSTTTYNISVLDAGGGFVWKSNNTTLSGASPINLNSITPS